MTKITISGLPDTGKGILRKMLEEEYQIPSFSVGDLRGKYAQMKANEAYLEK